MGKEIERKWIGILTEDLREILKGKDFVEIKDYYFNDYTRLRNIDGKWFITVKSLGNDVREEFEFEIDKSHVDFIPSPTLVKKRFFHDYKGHKFEINVFRDIAMLKDEHLATNLIIVECELKDKDEEIILPNFLGKEVTFDSSFYGRILFQRIKQDYKEPIRGIYELKL